MKKLMKSIVYGTATGDALGVPVEFLSRKVIGLTPVTRMIGLGTHNQPAGTWSDDTSMLLAIVDGISVWYDLPKIANNFVKWRDMNKFTAHGFVFDIGLTTDKAISNIAKSMPLENCGCTHNGSQGNGSLMRTLALVPLLINQPIEERYRITTEVSSLTHAHFNCKFACFFLVEYGIMLHELKDKINFGVSPLAALILTQDKIKAFMLEGIITGKFDAEDLTAFDRVCDPIENLTEDSIGSGGHVMDTLLASIWCLVTTNTYSEAVLKSVNLGYDTDTTGAVTGGLAGIVYGFDAIPKEWVDVLANKELLDSVIDGFDCENNPHYKIKNVD